MSSGLRFVRWLLVWAASNAFAGCGTTGSGSGEPQVNGSTQPQGSSEGDSATTQTSTSTAPVTEASSTSATTSAGEVATSSVSSSGSAPAPSSESQPTSESSVTSATDVTSDTASSDENSASSEEPEVTEPVTVTLSVPSGTFVAPLSVEAVAAVAGDIRVTLDGTAPTIDSPLYAGSIELTNTTQVRAQLFVDGVARGASTTGMYIARDFEATSNIPILIVDGYQGGKPADKETYHDAAFMLFEPVDGVADISTSPTVVSRSGYRLRGQSSQSFEQSSYRVELWGEDGMDLDQPLAGMPAESDWGLVAPYVDRSLLRNPFVYALGREIGLEAPSVAWVELYINHDDGVLRQSHYEGVYWLTELIKNAKNRLDLKELNEQDTALPDITGGFIFSFEYQAVEGTPIECEGDDIFFRRITGGLGNNMTPPTAGFCWTDLELRDPEPANDSQLAYLSQYLHEFHGALHTQPLGDWGAYADKASFVDHFIISEFTRNMDAYNKSAYYHKDREGLLKAGPLWDYNLSLGVGGFFDNTETEGWQLNYRLHTTDWFLALAENPEFMALVSARWQELRTGTMSDEALVGRVDAMAAQLVEAAGRDFERWPVNSISSFFEVAAGETWAEQVEVIRSWMLARAAWLDTAVDTPIDVEDYPLTD
jgi:hypothetical protein